MAMSQIRSPICQTVAPHHAYYYSGISDILTLDETIKRNPQALVQLCLGAFKAGMREFTAMSAVTILVRVTRDMVRLSDLEKYRAEGSRTNTTWLGEEPHATLVFWNASRA